jgi:cytoskeleton protein RodZ
MPDHRVTELGSRLRHAREARGISLRQIANVTKISVRALEAVERNDLSHLPGGIFTRAFVRAYATEVGLDPEATLRDFLSQAPQPDDAFGDPAPVATGGSWTERVPIGAVVRAAAAVALVAVLAYGLVLWYGGAVGDQGPASAEPVAVQAAPAAPATVSGASVQHAAGRDEPPSDPILEEAPAGTFTVLLTARGPCWVSLAVDGRRATEQLLAAGARLSLRAEQEIVLKIGDAGAVSLDINGRPARVLGGPGRVVTARIGADNLDDYLVAR